MELHWGKGLLPTGLYCLVLYLAKIKTLILQYFEPLKVPKLMFCIQLKESLTNLTNTPIDGTVIKDTAASSRNSCTVKLQPHIGQQAVTTWLVNFQIKIWTFNM